MTRTPDREVAGDIDRELSDVTDRKVTHDSSRPAVGIGLPIVGRYASPEHIRLLATVADRLGFSSVSLAERLALPGAPDWSNDFGLPESPSYDALQTLGWVAAHTERIALRTDVLLPLFQNPVVVARRISTLDHLSGGRVRVAMGIGWMPEEFAATGTPMARRGDRFEECVAAIRACWGPDPVEHHGGYYDIPPTRIGPKPLEGMVPIDIGALAPAALERAARIGDGFSLGFRDWDSTVAQLEAYRAAGGAGRVVVRAGPMRADAQHAEPTTAFDEDHVLEDIGHLGELGVDELIWDLNVVERPPQRQVEAYERLAAALDHA